MTRRVHKPRTLMHISREQAAVALAAGAVACLSSAIVHWSCGYPVREPVWQHPFFGELGDEAAFTAPSADTVPTSDPGCDHRPGGTEIRASQAPLPERLRQHSPEAQPDTAARGEIIPVQFTQSSPSDSRHDRPLTAATASAAGAAWLCGEIEEATTEQPVARSAAAEIRFQGRAPTDN